MPEERIGTKVELDIRGALKGYDELIDRLKQTEGAWQNWISRVKASYPSLDKIQAAIKQNADRLNELRFTTEKATKASREEYRARRALATGLKEILGDYRAQERAVKDQARAQELAARKAEQAQKRQKRATEAATRAQERQTKSTSRNLKKMVLWGIGAASAYRMYMKLRRAAAEFVTEVIKGTSEEDRLTAASKALRAAMAAAFGPEILRAVDNIANAINRLANWTTDLAVKMEVVRQITAQATDEGNTHAQMLIAQGVSAEAAARGTGMVVDIQQLYTDALATVNQRIDEFNEKTEEQTEVSKKAAQAYERYQQRLYRITENRLKGLLRAHKAYYDALADMALADARRAEDLAIETARRREDWARNAARRRAALLRQYNEQSLQAERSYARAARRLAEDRARRLLEIERRYQDRLLEIERSYSRSMYEAIATRDATAALRAMRQRREDLADARRDRDRARADVESDYARRLRELRENLEEQRRLARRSYEEALAELERSLREQEEDLALSLRRREEDAELSRKRQLQDLKLSLAEQMRATIDQYNRDRRLANIEYHYREDAYAAHLARMRALAQAYQAAFQAPVTPTGWGGGVQQFAEGGAMVATGPTMALFGERGPELVIAQPLPPAPQSFMVSGSVRHEVSTVIQQSMAGFEGRIAGAVHTALAEVIR